MASAGPQSRKKRLPLAEKRCSNSLIFHGQARCSLLFLVVLLFFSFCPSNFVADAANAVPPLGSVGRIIECDRIHGCRVNAAELASIMAHGLLKNQLFHFSGKTEEVSPTNSIFASTFKKEIFKGHSSCSGTLRRAVSLAVQRTVQTNTDSNYESKLHLGISFVVKMCHLNGAYDDVASTKTCQEPNQRQIVLKNIYAFTAQRGKLFCATLKERILAACKLIDIENRQPSECVSMFNHYITQLKFTPKSPIQIILKLLEKNLGIDRYQTWDIALSGTAPPANTDGTTTPEQTATTPSTTSANSLTFYPQSDANNYVTRDEWKTQFAKLMKQSSRGRGYTDTVRRLDALKIIGENISRQNVRVDKQIHPYSYRIRIEAISQCIKGVLHDAGDIEASEIEKNTAVRDILRNYINSRVFKNHFGSELFVEYQMWKDFSVVQGANLYYFVNSISTAEYKLFRETSLIPPKLRKYFKSPYWLPSYTAVLKYGNEHFNYGYEEEAFQGWSKFGKVQESVLHGAGLSITRTPTSVLTEATSFASVKKYMHGRDFENYVVLQNVQLIPDAATTFVSIGSRSVSCTIKNIPWPTDVNFREDEQRDWLCICTMLRTLKLVCGAADVPWRDDIISANRLVSISATKPAVENNEECDIDDEDQEVANIGLGPQSEVVVLLELHTSTFIQFKNILDGNVGRGQRNNAFRRRAVSLHPFKPAIPKNYGLVCDIDGTQGATRFHAQKGQGGYASMFCYSSEWTHGIHKQHKLASVNLIIPGDDAMAVVKKFTDSMQFRAHYRRAATHVIFDREKHPWILNIKWVVDSKCSASMCGGGAGNSRHSFVPGFKDTRDDTVPVWSLNKLTEKFDWENKVCSASRFYELADELKKCNKIIHIALGFENLLKRVPACMTEMKKPTRDADAVVRACKDVAKAGTPKKRRDGSNGKSVGVIDKQSRFWYNPSNQYGAELRNAITNLFWCKDDVHVTLQTTVANQDTPAEEAAGAEHDNPPGLEQVTTTAVTDATATPPNTNTPVIPTTPVTQANVPELPTTVATAQWAEPPKCNRLSGSIGGFDQGWVRWYVGKNSPLILAFEKALENYVKSETPLLQADTIEKLRRSALQTCQQDVDLHTTTVDEIKARLAAATAAFDLAATDYKTKNTVNSRSLETTRAFAEKRAKRFEREKYIRLYKTMTGPAPPVSVCELYELLKKDQNNDKCKTLSGTVSTNLFNAAKNVCEINPEELTSNNNGVTLYKAVPYAAITSYNNMMRTTPREEFGGLIGQHLFGDLDYFHRGDCATTDAMHAWFRAVGSMTTVMISDIRQYDLNCKWKDGTSTRFSLFSNHMEKVAGAKVGKAMYSEQYIIKRANSGVFQRLVYESDWAVSFDPTVAQTDQIHHQMCDYETETQRGWRAVQKYVAGLFYFYQHAVDHTTEFGFDNIEASDVWLEQSTKNLFKLLETMR